MSDPEPAPEAAPHEIIVQFQRGEMEPWSDARARELATKLLSGTVAGHDVHVERVFDLDVVERLGARARKLKRERGDEAALFGRDYYVSVPAAIPVEDLPDLVEAIRARESVARVEIAWPGTEPAALPGENDLWRFEGYAEGESPHWVPYDVGLGYGTEHVRGTNAWYAWRFPGGDGRDTWFLDIERGWDLKHPDLVAHNISLEVGRASRKAERVRHGTSVLGIVCARDDDGSGVIGLAPGLSKVMVASYRRRARNRKSVEQRIEKTIGKAADLLRPGDVLLLEVEIKETSGGVEKLYPAESRETIYKAIELATDSGVIVIEAAGNGGMPIDALLHGDSGAVIVGSARQTIPNKQLATSNHGASVHCWSWGNRVATCDALEPPAAPYTGYFDGTSAAAAIVAGIAASVQGAHRAALGSVILPPDIRDVLRAGGLDADDGSGGAAPIGKQPDVRKIIDDKLDLPFPWIRDSEEDEGEPGIDLLHACPDMVLRAPASVVAAPPFPDDTLAAGDTAELHLRVHNRAGRKSGDLEIDVFWSDPSLAVTSFGWTHIDTIEVSGVPAANGGFGHLDDASLSFTLPRAPWQLSLLAVLRHDTSETRLASGAVPQPPHRAWLDRIRTTAYRNLLFVPVLPALDPDLDEKLQRLPFVVPGPEEHQDDAVGTRICIEPELPGDARLYVEIPGEAAREMGVMESAVALRAKTGAAVLPLSCGEATELPALTVEARSRVGMQVLVGLSPDRPPKGAALRVTCDRGGPGVEWRFVAARPPSA